MTTRSIQLTDQLYEYMVQASVREPDIFRELRERTAGMAEVSMQISPEQGQFMAFLVRLLAAANAIEIGVFTGYSSLWTASALSDSGRLIACDVNRKWTDIAAEYWRKADLDHKIHLELKPALETLDELINAGETGRFDFVFIDADKPNYANYYERALVLLRSGGVIVIDNVLWSGRVVDESLDDADTCAIRRFNMDLKDDTRVHLSMLPVGDGLTLVMKR